MRRSKYSYLRATHILKFATVLIFILLILPAFIFPDEQEKTDKYEAPDIEIYMNKGIYNWVEKNPYIKKLSSTRFWEDLQLSGQFINLLTMGDKIENQTGIHLGSSYMSEILDAPVEISIWNIFDKDNDNSYVLVMDVDPKYQGLIKLAEVYVQTIKKSQTIEKNNIKLLKTEWLDSTLFHAMVKNQLVVSNDLKALTYILEKAKKDAPIRTFRDSGFYKTYNESQNGNLKCRIDMGSWFENLKSIINKKEMQLAINMDLDENVNFYTLYLTGNPGFKSSDTTSLDQCKDFIPREPIFALSGSYDPQFYMNLIKNLPNYNGPNDANRPNIDKDILPFFNERFFIYITELENKNTPNIVNGIIGFSLDKLKPDQQKKIIDFIQIVMTGNTGMMKIEKGDQKNTPDIYHFEQNDTPTFCIIDKWLLIGTDINSLKQSLSVYNKKIPNISDGKGYQKLSKNLSSKGFLQMLIEPAPFCKTIIDHLLHVADGFGPAEVKLKIQPAADIFSTIPTFGIFFELQKDMLKGKVEFAGK